MKQIGILDLGIKDIITVLQTDTVLGALPSYGSMWEVSANTPKPCQSVDFEREQDSLDSGNSGGCIDDYSINGFIIQYLPPDYAPKSIRPKLDEYRERTRNAIKESIKTDSFEVLESLIYKESKPLPWMEQYQTGPRLVAHRMITDFTATYAVKEE